MAAHAIWKGSVGFGLVNIPVSLYSGEESGGSLGFTMLDKRDMSPVGYKKVNKKTGREVTRQDIVKGFEYREGEFVTVTDADFKKAAPEKTQRVDIQAFVRADEIDPAFFSQPYYLEPAARADKVYALLREAMKRSGKIGIATVVIRARQYLAAVVPREQALELVLLRYPEELRDPSELHLPEGDAKTLKLSEAELKMAERLIEDLAAPWEPRKYKDEYKEQLLDFIRRKAEKGEVEEAEPPEKPKKAPPPADIMALLKASVEGGGGRAKAPVPAGRRHGGGRHVVH
jgi:DNA end-binding protein Ku